VTVPDAEILIRATVIAFEMALLGFLYFISRFYEMKFGKRTYYNAYLIPVAAFLLAMIPAMFITGSAPLALVLLNGLTLLVLAVFGLRLRRMMMGVSK
jgi:hypothetical protein